MATRRVGIATVNVDILKWIGGQTPAPSFTAESVKTKADMLKAMADSYDYGTALLKEQTDATITQTIDGRFLGPSTRARLFWFLLGHSMDIYGQMVVYLRLNGIVPPYTIKVGQTLRLPAPVETEGTAVAAAPQPPPPQSPPPGAAPPPGPDPLTHSPTTLEPGGKTGVQAEELPPTGTSAASTPTPPASATPVPSSGPLPPKPPAVGKRSGARRRGS